MAEISSLEMVRFKRVRHVVADIYVGLVEKVIAEIKALPDNCRQSGDDSKLKDVWEEFKYQFQGEESFCFELYEHTVRALCESQVMALDSELKGLLWFWSDGYEDWYVNHDDDDDDLSEAPIPDDITKELYDRVCKIANNEPLAVDPDEARDRDRYEEDKRIYNESCESSIEETDQTLPSGIEQPSQAQSRSVKLKGGWEGSSHTIEIKPNGTLVADVYDFSGLQGGDRAWGLTIAKKTQSQLLFLLGQDSIFKDQIRNVSRQERLLQMLPLFADRFQCFNDFKFWLQENGVPFTEYRDMFACPLS